MTESTRSARAACAHDVVFTGGSAADEEATRFFEAPGAAARYELRGEVARGGMGRILEAWDARHGRAVAIKVLLRGDAASTRRFAREARITARLDHPAIVPMHEAGRLAGGEPFYAMKLVRGESLRAAMERARSREERLALVPHLVAIADALAYAHAQRIIHRDLKPSNVLVGRFGETVVIDWGLAKDMGDRDEPPAVPAVERAHHDAHTTLAGDALGTPGYMPPEQARGGAVDERSDVYAIGAMLYELLAGTSPYPSNQPRDVLAGPPPALAQAAPDAPPELATIAAKAMAREPADRYPTARELADDLRRFATGQLVSAHRYGIGALARRFVARHKAAIAIAAVLSCALVVFGVFSVRRIVRERDRADAANAVATRGRHAAEKLIAFVISDLRSRLEDVGRLDVLGGVGKEVNAYYDSTGEADSDVDALEQRAAAQETLAEVEAAKGDNAAAGVLFDAAGALRVRVIALRGDDGARAAEGERLVKLARFQRLERGESEARASCERAVGIADAIVARGGGALARGLTLEVRARSLFSEVRSAQGDRAGGGDEATKAVDAGRRLVALEHDAPSAQRTLADALYQRGRFEHRSGELAVPSLTDAIDLRERLVAAATVPSDRIDLSKAYTFRSYARSDSGRGDDAVSDATRARDLLAPLVEQEPENVEWRTLLAQANDTLCNALSSAHRYEDAVAACRRATAGLTELIARSPDSPHVAEALVLASERQGWVLSEMKRYDEAEASVRPTIAIAERFAARGDSALWTARLADAHGIIAENALHRGARDVARAEYAKTIETLAPIEGSTAAYDADRSLLFARLALAELDTGVTAHDLRVASMRQFVRSNGKGDQSDEPLWIMLARACAAIASSRDAGERALVEKTIALLDGVHAQGNDESARRAQIATAKAALAR